MALRSGQSRGFRFYGAEHTWETSLAAFVWLLLFLNCLAAPAALADEDVKPSWNIDLAPTLKGPALGHKTGSVEMPSRPVVSVWFLNNGIIAASFLVQNTETPKLSTRDSTARTSLQVQIVVVNAADGHVVSTGFWPTHSRDSRIVAAYEEQMVIQAGTEISLVSEGFQGLHTVELPESKSDWKAYTSPTSQHVLFVHPFFYGKGRGPWIWISTKDLSVKSWDDVSDNLTGISDNEIAMSSCVGPLDCPDNMKIRELHSDWREIPGTANNQTMPQFITDDLVWLWGNGTHRTGDTSARKSGWSARVLRINGDIVLDDELEGCWFSEPKVSSDGKRFVMPSCHLTGYHPSLDMGGTDIFKSIAVYDSPFTKRSHFLLVKGPKIADWASVALSPDGLQFAILSGTHLELIRLPSN